MYIPDPNNPPTKPAVCTVATLSGVGFILITLASATASHRGTQDSDVAFFDLVFSFWIGLPLIMLGQLKVFWRFPRLVKWLYAMGCCALVWMLFTVLVVPTSSTAGVAAFYIPLLLLMIYSVVVVVIKLNEW